MSTYQVIITIWGVLSLIGLLGALVAYVRFSFQCKTNQLPDDGEHGIYDYPYDRDTETLFTPPFPPKPSTDESPNPSNDDDDRDA